MCVICQFIKSDEMSNRHFYFKCKDLKIDPFYLPLYKFRSYSAKQFINTLIDCLQQFHVGQFYLTNLSLNLLRVPNHGLRLSLSHSRKVLDSSLKVNKYYQNNRMLGARSFCLPQSNSLQLYTYKEIENWKCLTPHHTSHYQCRLDKHVH